jgi:hypothetical protein
MNQSTVSLLGPFPFGDGRRAPTQLMASYWCSETFLLGASQVC